MDKSNIKSFAVWARRKMIESVTEKAERIGIKEDSILKGEKIQGGFRVEGIDEIFYMPFDHREALIAEIKEKGYKEVMEEAAYTWFNRFIGLRYMEVNDYLPSKIRILSSEVEGKTEPDVLSNIPAICEELELDAEPVYQLLDSGRTEDREKAYKIILVKQCNELGKVIPQMFEKISDYTELLIPDNLLEEGSVIRKLVRDIDEADWKEEVEIIGWIYQYYISEKKDEVFVALKKNVKITKENIPAATQLFTPKWIVKYMVENSLGRLWLEGHPNAELQSEWKYYLEEAQQEAEVEEELKKIREEHSLLTPEDIKVLDPCMGSGHILVYAFEVLYEIYKTAGYSEREIPRLILENNLYGLDIDDRAAQLASFALIMKARHYNRRLFREIEKNHLELNLCSIQESNEIPKAAIEWLYDEYIKGQDLEEVAIDVADDYEYSNLLDDINYLVDTYKDAKEYGSILEVKKVNFESIKDALKNIENDDNLLFADYKNILLEKLPLIIKQAEIMSRKYEACITNPPYLGRKGMGDKLKCYIEKQYFNSKSDLYSVFIEKANNFILEHGLISLITQHSWMFLTSFEKLRKSIIENSYILSLVHLGAKAFEEIAGEVVQTVSCIMRKKKNRYYNGKYIRLVEYDTSEKELEYFNQKNQCIVSYEKIKYITDNILAYWANDSVIDLFKDEEKVLEYAYPKQGLATGNNDRFLRFWHEVDILNIGYKVDNEIECKNKNYKWIPCNKGGSSRKWYGNNYYVINWFDNGKDIKQLQGSVIRNEQFYFKEGLTWSTLSTNALSMRFCDKGFIFETKGSMCFPKCKDNIFYLLAYFNSKLINYILNMISPTLDYHEGPIGKLPIKNIIDNNIDYLSRDNIKMAQDDWDSFETSWDFKLHPLVTMKKKYNLNNISDSFDELEKEWNDNFYQLKANEEELNRIFIDIYGLQGELTPEEEDKDVTIRKADRERDIKSFISYAVGCMFGRYSLDAEGLIYAGGDFADKWNIADKKVRNIVKDEDGNVVSETWVEASYIPDADNIIPVTDDEYFEDDIVSRFIEFVRTVYGDETLDENLDYIADSIGRKSSETAKQCIRRYFLKDFYKDHLKIYQKRPIYWMFDSGKNDGFKCLVYMHRYNEQTVAKVRTDYLHMLQRKYEAQINVQQLTLDSVNSSAKDKTIAKKKIDKITKQIHECMEYDQVVSYIANECIAIDLDDGVKVNYAKFQGVGIINSKGKEEKMNLLAKI